MQMLPIAVHIRHLSGVTPSLLGIWPAAAEITFAGTVKKPKMLRWCTPLTALSTAMSPNTSPDSPTAQLPE